ncbi:MAG: guanylate kinase [Clostridia bacterium]|nr:guanylate kinase [Clostridia bacterium]
MSREGLLIVVSGPSGTGKGTVLDMLRKANENVRYSVSATTRQPREGEIDGQNYFFKTVDEFKSMIEKNELVEWVQYCNNYYGTPKKYIDDSKASGIDIILEIEVEGAINIKKMYPDSVLIFILPPSFEELQRRIEGRGTEKPEVIAQRMEKARREFLEVDKYDYVVINNNVGLAVEDINSIIRSEKLRYSRNTDIRTQLGV